MRAMRLRLVSDGTLAGTMLTDIETGAVLPMMKFSLQLDAQDDLGGLAVATVTVLIDDLRIEGEMSVEGQLLSALVSDGREDRRQKLAAYAHEAWSGWMRYLFGKALDDPDDALHGTVRLPGASAQRWKRQMETAYADLPESEKASDLAEADKMLAIMAGEQTP